MKKLITLALVTSCATSAFAVTAQSGMYLTPLLGYTFPTYYTDSSMTAASGVSTTHTNKNFTWGGAAGYEYAFTQHVLAGVEVAYVNMGRTVYNFANGQSTNFGNYGLETLLTATYLSSSGFDVFVKGGGSFQSEANNALTVGSITFNGNSTQKYLPVLGAGFGYQLHQGTNISVNLNVQYQRIFGNTQTNIQNDLGNTSNPQAQNVVLVGLTFKFPMGKQAS